MRWNSKPEDEIQWVAGLYQFLDYGDRYDVFKTGRHGAFNQQGAAAIAVADGGIFTANGITSLTALQGGTYTGP